MKINEFSELAQVTNDDLLLGWDAETNSTKKIKASTFKNYVSIDNSSSWTPGQIALMWLDGSDLDTYFLDSNNKFERWIDKSSGRTINQTSDSLKPSISSFNNKTVLAFNNSFLRATTSIDYGNNISIFAVASYNTANRWGLYDSSPNSTNVIRNFSRSSSYISNTFEWWDRSPSLPIDCQVNQFNILNFNYQLNPNRIITKYVNGANFASASNSSTSGISWGNFTIGAINTNNAYFDGALAEFLIMPFCNLSLRQKMEGYLAWKWGLTSLLNSNHPYKSVRV